MRKNLLLSDPNQISYLEEKNLMKPHGETFNILTFRINIKACSTALVYQFDFTDQAILTFSEKNTDLQLGGY